MNCKAADGNKLPLVFHLCPSVFICGGNFFSASSASPQ